MDLLNNEMEEGVIILIVGMSIVFLSLILLNAVFSFAIPKILSLGSSNKKTEIKKEVKPKEQRSGEEMAAVAAAVYMFLEEAHDEENAILTIDKSSKSYSPWSSKIYVTHNLARR